jgi:hypothetical protein
MDDKYFSTDHEPALGHGRFDVDPAEHRAQPVDRPADELEALRDSVAAEPALPEHADPSLWNRWLAERRGRCSRAGNLAVTALAAVLSGPLAIVGALMAGHRGTSGYVYAVVFGPVIEELLKQSGMTYLLEKKPYRVFAAWQFLFAALVSGLTFGAIENLVYIHLYAPAGSVRDPAALAAFRWAVCTPLHVVCAAIASLGLVRVWNRQVRTGRAAELTAALPWFAVAMVLHGAYNFAATFVSF